jgi:hypothetical protein
MNVDVTPPYRFYAWLSRPAADQSFNITAKMIDPLGRIASLQADVPPLPPVPKLGPVQVAIDVGPITSPPRMAVEWEILSTVQPELLHQYELSVTPPGLQVALDAVQEVAGFPQTPVQIRALFNKVARFRGTQRYLMFLPPDPNVEISVTLTDPVGRTDTQTGVPI